MVPILFEEKVRIPAGINSLKAFRRWARSDEFPQQGRISFLRGELWVDMSLEQFFSHNQVKTCMNAAFYGFGVPAGRGYYCSDGIFLSNPAVDLSTVPDGLFVSFEALEQGCARLIGGVEAGFVELEGTPDMVLEIISAKSVRKDTVVLRDLYWQAGITEYWLVDARWPAPRFEILRRGGRGYGARNQAGWVKSTVFGHSFRFTQESDPLGNPQYTLAFRP